MLTLLSLNIIMVYYIGHEEGMICFIGLCNVHTVYAQSTIYVCMCCVH